MSQALRTDDLSAEARAFLAPAVRQPEPPPTAAKPAAAAVPPPPHPDRADPVPELLPTAWSPGNLPPQHRPVSMTFRLAPELPAALLRASVERKLRQQRPCTQQEIVSEAVQQWLKTHGFLT